MYPFLTWHISQIIVDILYPIVTTYDFNYSKGHWLLSDPLNVIISMSLKEEMNCPLVLDTWIDHDSFLNIVGGFYNEHEKGSLWGHRFFPFFFDKYDKRRTHNMLS